MKAKLKKINNVNFDHARTAIQQQRTRCIEIINTALEVAEKYTGDNRLWFGDCMDAAMAKDGYTIDDIYVKDNTLLASISGEYDNDTMAVEAMEISYLIDLVEFIRDNMDEFIEQWEEDED